MSSLGTIADRTPQPIDYVMTRLAPYFGTIHQLISMFDEANSTLRTPPQRIHTPTFTSPEGPQRRVDDMFDTLPFWIGESIPYGGLNAGMKKQVYHWGPDACLVVRKKGSLGEAGVMYPIK